MITHDYTESGIHTDENTFYLIQQNEFDFMITPQNSTAVAKIYTDEHVSIKRAVQDTIGKIPAEAINFHIIKASKWDALTH